MLMVSELSAKSDEIVKLVCAPSYPGVPLSVPS